VLDPNHQEDRMTATDRPTVKQLAYLRALAARVGQSFAYPRTRRQASAEIRRLGAAQRRCDSRLERQGERRERRAIQRDLQERATGAVRVDLERETTGYGANATWR
jgi:hypothetical protein